ncbi:MAG TPA: hypothetical protein HA321_00175 [Halobacteriales archaeon]|nr:hypothetical protein [Halobacteriales archaeon]
MSSSNTDKRLDDFSDRIEILEGELRREIERNYSSGLVEWDSALDCLMIGFGPAIAMYIEARIKGKLIPITPEQFERIESIMNGWLEIYAKYYGEDIEANFSIREASLLFLETHDIQDVAEMLTKIPKKLTSN